MTMTPAVSVLAIWRYRFSERAGYVALALLGLVVVVVLYTFDPRNPGIYPICPFLGLTGYHCPGCGTLRALHQLLHGNIITALGYNPLTILSLPFIAYSYLAALTRAFRIPALPRVFVPHRLIWTLFVSVVAFWLLRNLPFEPLTFLAP